MPGTWRKLACIFLAAVVTIPAQEPAVFHSVTRLVEVDVVIRDKHGPVRGLSKDDFTLFDCKASERSVPSIRDMAHLFSPCKGKRQPLDVFREVNSLTAPAAPGLTLAPGAVSNRIYNDGKPLTGATVVLMDQLNTSFELREYQRRNVVKFLRSLGNHDRFALYSLGTGLHVLQDFTNDPEKLVAAAAKLDSGTALSAPANDPGINDPGINALEGLVYGDAKRDATVQAVKNIVRRLEGVPGRKSIVWIGQGFNQVFNPRFGPPEVRNLLAAANIAVYPVMVRGVDSSDIASSRGMPPPPGLRALDMQYDNRQLAESLGGRGFDDAADIHVAVNAAQDDGNDYYVLGFYPAEKDLDGGTHQLTLDVSKIVSKRPGLVLTYRQVYLATKSGLPDEDQPKLVDLLRSPIDATAIGLTGAIVPDPARPGIRELRATVSIADLQLRREQDRWVGSFKAAARFERMESAVLTVTPPIGQTVALSLTDAEFEAKRASGWELTLAIPPGMKAGSVHLAVQDGVSGAAGSVRVPIPIEH